MHNVILTQAQWLELIQGRLYTRSVPLRRCALALATFAVHACPYLQQPPPYPSMSALEEAKLPLGWGIENRFGDPPEISLHVRPLLSALRLDGIEEIRTSSLAPKTLKVLAFEYLKTLPAEGGMKMDINNGLPEVTSQAHAHAIKLVSEILWKAAE